VAELSRYYLRKVSIEGFRGINNQGNPLVLEFKPTKVTSIFGENGTGKSSVFEALEYAISGSVGRLAALQRVENPDRYYVNQFHSGPAVVILEFEADDTAATFNIRVERMKNGGRTVTSQDTSDPVAFLNSIKADTLFMDYDTFTRFIFETPLERGRAFVKLLGLEKVSVVRANLGSLNDPRSQNSDLELSALRGTRDSANRNRRNAVTAALNQLTAIKPHNFTADTFDLHHVANHCLSTLTADPVIKPLIVGKPLSRIDYKACLERLNEADRSGDRTKLGALHLKSGRIGTPVDLQGLSVQIDALLLTMQQRQALVERSKGTAFQALYQAAQQVLNTDWQNDKCPVCERSWEHQSGLDLPTFVAHELEGYRDIVEMDRTIKTAWTNLVRDPFISKLADDLEQRPREAAPTMYDTGSMPTEQDLAAFRGMLLVLEENRCKAHANILSEIAEIEARLPSSLGTSIQIVAAAQNLTSYLNDYVSSARQEQSAADDLVAVETWQKFIGTAAIEFSQAETTLVQATVAMLEQDIRTLYESIMPSASVLPKLSRQEGTEQLHLMLEQFYGIKDAHAVPLLSESYRNALGMAVFLAASRQRTYGGRFLVLDDVTSSFDSGHQTYLLEAIYKHLATPENPGGLQIIVLSHDGALKRYFDMAVNSGKSWTNYRLQGTAPTGFVAAKAIPLDQYRNDIAQPLSMGNLNAAKRAVRPHLEASLIQIVQQVHIRVPLDIATIDHKRMLGDMMEAIKWEISLRTGANMLILDSLAVKDITQTIIPLLQANAWAHYATDSMASVDANAIQSVLSSIDTLVDKFKYTCVCNPAKPERKFFFSLGEKQKGCGPNCK
jgi:ABC-type hemin transport system ATPase subunit